MQSSFDGRPYSLVKLIADGESEAFQTGKFRHQIVNCKSIDRVNVLVNSNDRTASSVSCFDFFVELSAEAHIRNIKLTKAILPILPTINDHNNLIKVTLNGISGEATLTNGFYTPTSLCNMMQSVLSVLWNSLIAGALVTVSYDSAARNITIEDISPGPGPYTWYFNTSTSNISASFFAHNHVATFPTGATSVAVSQSSTSLEMIYSRYLYIRSHRLVNSQYGFSVISSSQSNNIVAIIDLASGYSSEQFNPSAAFPSTVKVFDLADHAPILNMANRNQSLKNLDILISDEYGYSLTTIYADGSFNYDNSLWFVAEV